MRRTLLVFLAVFLAAGVATIAFFFVSETSRAAPSPSEGGHRKVPLPKGLPPAPTSLRS